jgi:hypothetical protein
MADERIDGLPTTAGDVKTFLFIMDKNGELSAVQVPYADMLAAIESDIDLSSFAVKTNVLELNNSDPFTPNATYEPATKKYVDDKNVFGTFAFGDIAGTATKTVTIGETLPSTNYHVSLTIVQPNGVLTIWPPLVINKTTTTFDILIAESGTGTNNVNFEWMITLK